MALAIGLLDPFQAAEALVSRWHCACPARDQENYPKENNLRACPTSTNQN